MKKSLGFLLNKGYSMKIEIRLAERRKHN